MEKPRPYARPLMAYLSLALAALLHSIGSAALELRADRDVVPINETLRLEIRSGSDAPLSDLDLSPIEQHFEIRGRSSQREFSMVNGRTEGMQRLSLSLKPLRVGRVQIAPLSHQGKRSATVNITVSEAIVPPSAANDASVMLEAEVDKNRVFPGEQLIYTLRLLYRTSLSDAQMSALQINNAQVTELDDRSYQRQIKGEQYQVVEKRYALQFRDTGSFNIGGPTLTATAGAQRGRFGFGFGLDPLRGGQSIRLAAETVTVSIMPLPTAANPAAWLPAHDLQLSESWQDANRSAEVGQPITRSIEIYAIGLPGESLPELAQDEVAGLNRYPEKPSFITEPWSDGIAGKRIDTYALIPTRAGTITLPALSLEWWNTKTQRMETASLPARTFNVKPSAAANSTHGQAEQNDAFSRLDGERRDASRGSESRGPATGGEDMADNKPATPAVNPASSNGVARIWTGIAGAALLGWLLTALGWWRSHRRNKQLMQTHSYTAQHDEQQQTLASARRALLAACKRNDANAAQQHLDQWLHCLANTIASSSGQKVDRKTLLHCADTAQRNALGDAIFELEQQLFSRLEQDAAWRGEQLHNAVRSYRPTQAHGKQPQLPPLYPDSVAGQPS